MLYIVVEYPSSSLLTECYGVPSPACNLMTIRTWRGSDWNGAPFMHSMHCFFALGLFISPLLSKPFLTGRERHPGMEATRENLKPSTNSIFGQGKRFICHCIISRSASLKERCSMKLVKNQPVPSPTINPTTTKTRSRKSPLFTSSTPSWGSAPLQRHQACWHLESGTLLSIALPHRTESL